MLWKHILVCLSPGPRAPLLAGEAVGLALAMGADLHVVYAGADTPEHREALRSVVREAGCPSEPPMTLRPGDPSQVVIDTAKRIGADLVVAGALEKEKITGEILGSTSRRLARRLPMSILLVANLGSKKARYQRIGVTMRDDRQTLPLEDLKFALGLADTLGTREVHVLHEDTYFDRLERKFAAEQPALAGIESQRMLEFRAMVNQLTPDRLETVFVDLHDGEGTAVSAYARRNDLDLLVYPSPPRTLTFWDRFFRHPVEIMLEQLPHSLLILRSSYASKTT